MNERKSETIRKHLLFHLGIVIISIILFKFAQVNVTITELNLLKWNCSTKCKNYCGS